MQNPSDIAQVVAKRSKLRIHWRLPYAGSDADRSRARLDESQNAALPDLDKQIEFARQAESLGIDSLLVDFGYDKADSLMLSAAIALKTERIKLIIASRSGLMSPAYFVQQLNTLSALIDGRFSLNIVAGHSPTEQRFYGDFLSHDERYARTGEYLDICHAFWECRTTRSVVNYSGKYYQIENGQLKTPFMSPDRSAPEVFIAGGSPPAFKLAKDSGDIWISLAQPVEQLKTDALDMLAHGREVGVRLSVICRSTRELAIQAAEQMLEAARDDVGVETSFVKDSDSVGIKRAFAEADHAQTHWLTPCLWNGAVKSHGAPAIALVGSPADIAAAVLEYHGIGVSQFIFSGWPQYDAMRNFGEEVLPLIMEKQ